VEAKAVAAAAMEAAMKAVETVAMEAVAVVSKKRDRGFYCWSSLLALRYLRCSTFEQKK